MQDPQVGTGGPDLRIVINMAASPAEGARTYATLLKACESFLKISPRLAGVIRRDSKVKDAIRHQTPILTRHPNSMAAADIEALPGGLVPAAYSEPCGLSVLFASLAAGQVRTPPTQGRGTHLCHPADPTNRT